MLAMGLALLLGVGNISGDCGSVPFVPGVEIFEPSQRAMIAWNGREEILVLSTDLRASKPTKVLEVIPLPSKPTVKQGDVKVFRKATALINRKLGARKSAGHNAGGGGLFSSGGKSAPPPPPARVVLHKTVGATDVTVVEVLTGRDFVDWVNKQLKARDVKNPDVPMPLRKVIREYLADGYRWFCFNVVSLGTRIRTKQAVEYRFKSDCLYYPMRITRTETGRTIVKLLVVTRGGIPGETFTGIDASDVAMPHESLTLTAAELAGVHLDSHKLLGRPETAVLRTWEVTGELSSFKHDLLAGRPHTFTLADDHNGTVYGPFFVRNGTQFTIGSERLTVRMDPADGMGANPTFHLKDRRYREPRGPFQLATGGTVVIGRRRCTVRGRRANPVGREDLKKPAPAVKGGGGKKQKLIEIIEDTSTPVRN